MKIFLHIGLHKTATTFFQYHVFPLFDPAEIAFNPPRLMECVHRIFTGAPAAGAELEARIREAQGILRELAADGTGKLLVSEEDFSQRFIRFNFAENQALLKRIFPEAVIIVFFRFQPDWLLSAYKQRVKHDPDLDLRSFLRQDGANGPGSIDPLCLDFAALLKLYTEAYGRGNVKPFFYEDFLADNKGVTDRLAALLGVTNKATNYRKVYKGDSALVILMRIRLRKLLKGMGRETIYSRKSDKGRELPSLARARRELAMPAFLAVVARKAAYKAANRLKTSSLLDWDMLRAGGMRGRLEAHYRRMNLELAKMLDGVPIPPLYLPR